jgi:nucleoside phosphorylase
METKVDKILFAGSAGSYGKIKEFDIVTSSSATNVEIGFFENLSYTPVLEQIRGIKTDVSRGTLPKVVVNSSSFITSDEAQSRLFLKHGLAIENMEFFAVLKVAQEFGIPAFGVFCITNMCDKNAHENFIKNHENAKIFLENNLLLNFKEYL